MRLMDTHCHLDYVIEAGKTHSWAQAQEVGVKRVLIPAVAKSNWARLAQLAEETGCYAAYGLHPIAQDEHTQTHLQELERWIKTYPTLAIGECGLDYAIEADRALQREYFAAQLDLAVRYDLPVIVHARKSLDEVLQMVRRFSGVRFVVHSFTGSNQQLTRLLDLGGYIGVGGTSTYERAQRLRRQLAEVEASRYLLETDAPDQPICGFQGQINEPAKVLAVARTLAQLRHESVDEIARQSWHNSALFFALDTQGV